MAEILVAVGQSIQAAINGADPGDTVKLASGTHILPGTLYVREGITLLGEDGAILDASGLTAGSYGIYVDEDGVTLSNFTLLGGGATGPARGIKAQADGAADRLEDLTITDVTVKNFHRAEVDINGADGAYLSNVTVDGQNTGGAGIALTDVTDVELNNIDVSNNNWGGVAIYSGGDFAATPNGSNGVTFTGTFTAPISAEQTQPILLQTANGYPIADYTLPDSYDYAVYNATAPDYLIFFGSAEEATAYALTSDAANSVIYQNAAADDVAFVEGNIVVYPGMSIPAANAAAKPGQVVHVIGNDTPGSLDDTHSGRANAPDWFTGGAGDDTFFGGSGGGDRFVYGTANAGDVTDILKIGQNVFLTTSEGTDLINGVEEIQFANGDVYAVSGTNIVVNTEADSNAALEDGAAVDGNVLTNDVDLDGASFVVHGIAAGASTTPTTGGLDAPVAGTYGSLTIAANGQYSYTADNANALAEGEIVTDTFTYTVQDGSALVTETITITVTGTNDDPVIATSNVHGAIFEDGDLDSATNETPASDFSVDYALSPAIQSALDLLTTTAAIADEDLVPDLLVSIANWLPNGSIQDAFAIVFNTLDDFYDDGENYSDVAHNTSALRLGMAYAEYLENGGRPLTDVIVKAAANRAQSLHDNLLGNFGLPTLADRFPGDHYDPTGATSTGIYLEIFDAGYSLLHDRPYFGGYTGDDAGPSRAFDLDNHLIPASFGKLVATDVDGDTLIWSVQGTGEGQYGTLHVDADGTWRYDLDQAKAQHLAEGQPGDPEVFTVQVEDGNGGLVTTTVTINVTGTNDAPEFDADFVWPTTLTEDEHGTPLSGNIATLISQVVSDPDGGDAVSLELTFTYPSGSGLGSWTATVDEAGNADYSVPASHADFNGDVSVLIKATDSHGAVTTKTITVTVTPDNDAPTIGGDTAGLVWEPGDLDAALGAHNPVLFTTLIDINDEIGDLFAANAHPDAITGGFDWDMDAILAGTKALLGPDAGDADAIAYVWSHIDRNYLAAVNGTPATSEASFRLGLEYVEYLQNGGKPLYDVIAKSGPAREQTLHDNIMSGVTGYALTQRWVNQHPNADLYAEFLGILTNDPALAPLIDRASYQGTTGETNTVLAFDIQHGFLPAASGQLTVTDPDAGDSHEWSATGSTPYGTFFIDPATGEWSFTFDPAAANGLNEGDVVPVDFMVTVTDSQGATDTQVVTITIKGSNDAPTVDQAISVAPTAEDDAFSFTIPTDAFDDVDTGAALTYTATLADGSPLPAWLDFDGQTFSGTPTNDGVGTISVKVTATDEKGAFTSQTFDLTVTNTNDAPTFGFHQGFETDRDGIFDASSAGWAGYGSVEVVTDFNGVSAADGSSFAILKEPTPIDDNTGPFSRFGGYRDLFVDGMTAETKVYLDADWAEGDGFSYSVAMNGSNGNHLQDYVFNVVMTDTGLKVGTGTGVDHDGPVPVSGNAGPIGAEGWYTLQHVFNNVNGELVVTYNVLDAGGIPVFTFDYATGHDIADVGGNRYAWYARIAVEDGIAVDDISLTGVDSGAATEDNAGNGSTVSLTGQVLFDDVDGDAIPTVSVATVPGSYIGIFNAVVTEDPSGASGGTITWTFDANVDGLTTGQTIIQTYDLTIDDGHGGSAVKTITVTITGTNDAPTVGSTIIDQTVAEDAAFSFAIPSDAFADVDDATLTYAATLADGSPLPSWLDFDDATGTFSGTPTDDEVGTISVKVTATDSFGEAVSQVFDLTVSNTPDVLDTSDLAGEVTEPVSYLSWPTDNGQVLVDTGSVTFSGSTTNQYGTFFVNPFNGKWTFTLGIGAAVQALNDGDQVDTIFTVTVHDLATGLDTTADVVITIHGTNEQINGSSGDDVGLLALMGSDYGDTINAGAGDDTVYGGGGNDTISGGIGDDTIYGGSGNDTIAAGGGDDYVEGGSGDDILNGDAGDDHIDGGSGNDTIDGGLGDDYLLGGSGDDFISGGAGKDQLFGGSGNDLLWGGEGRDVLTGGEGEDHFRFVTVEDSPRGGGRDLITDFEVGVDKIDLSMFDANTELDGIQQFVFRGEGDTSRKEDIGYLKFFHENGKTFILGGTDQNPDQLGELLIELDGQRLLTIDDFIGVTDANPSIGTSADDVFYFGAEQKTFTGNGGFDTFVLSDYTQSRYGTKWDIITDWSSDYVIDLRGMDADFSFVEYGAANRVVSTGQIKVFEQGGNTFIVGDQTGDGLADFRIQLNGDNHDPITIDNFLLV